MRIFITGGTGFIGKYVIQELNNGSNQLLILARNPKGLVSSKNLELIKNNLSNIDDWKRKVKKFKPQIAIHLAWEGIPDFSLENCIKNLKYGLDLYKFLSEINCKTILSTGSCWEYGNQNGKLSEDSVVKPLNAFTAAKNALHSLGQEIAKSSEINFIWVRLFYVYGPGQRKKSLIPYLIECAKANITPVIKNPAAENDFVYVEDVARAISQILQKNKKSDIFNVGSGKLTSVKHIIEIIFNLLEKSAQFKRTEALQTDSITSMYADISKIKKEVGWTPQTNFDKGLKKTIDYLSSEW